MVRAIRSGFRWVPAAAAVGLAVITTGQAPAPGPITRPYTSWKDYGGSADSMQYSALTQIDRWFGVLCCAVVPLQTDHDVWARDEPPTRRRAPGISRMRSDLNARRTSEARYMH